MVNAWLRRNAEFRAQKRGTQFGNQFLGRIGFTAESVAKVTVTTVGVT